MPDAIKPKSLEKAPAPASSETIRSVEVPELAPEQPVSPESTEPKPAVPITTEPSSAPPVTPEAPPVKDRVTSDIENVLSEDLTDMFLKLDPNTQKEFKEKGEETASKIRQMVQQAKVNVKGIFDLIKDWLKILPGVNKFFLEQEAKIKTDKIINLAEEEKRRGQDIVS